MYWDTVLVPYFLDLVLFGDAILSLDHSIGLLYNAWPQDLLS